MRVAARRWCLVAALAAVLIACGNSGNDTGRIIGSEITFDVPISHSDPRPIRLQGIERGSGPAGVVLAHMLGSSQGAWAPLVETLAKDGFHVLTFDFRGHGLSEGDRNPSDADLDLTGAIAKLRSAGATRILVVGASLGGTAALDVAASQNVAGVVTMSAPLDIGSLDAHSGLRAYHGPLLVLVAQNDDARYTSAARTIITSTAAAPKRLLTLNGSAHGTDLLVDDASKARAKTAIIDFLESHRG